ncbi:MAG: GNAT family N-acetyltransferase [Bacteroidia bacterium]
MITLTPLTRFNWENYLSIELTEAQQQYVPSVLYSLAQAKFENLFPFGIDYEGVEIGFLMYGDFNGICWLNRLMIDRRYQQKGLGKQAVWAFIRQMQSNPRFREIRTSYVRNNIEAALLFESLGFEIINEALSQEIVAVLNLD